jgi:hypothetical protein
MARRIVTAREQHQLLSPWRRVAMPQLHRGLGFDYDQIDPTIKQHVDRILSGEEPHPDAANSLLDHIFRTPGRNRHWSINPEQADASSSPYNIWTYGKPGNTLQVKMHGDYDGPDRALQYEEPNEDWPENFSYEQEWSLEPGDKVNMTGLEIRKHKIIPQEMVKKKMDGSGNPMRNPNGSFMFEPIPEDFNPWFSVPINPHTREA